MAHDVFISYSSHDQETARIVCNALEANNVSCWMAPRNILPGQEWMDAIMDALTASRCFVLIFSEASNQSAQVKREVENAVSEGLPVLPFRINTFTLSRHMRYLIGVSHWLEALEPPMEPHLDQLVETVHLLLSRTEPHDERIALDLEGELMPALGKADLQHVTLAPGSTLFHQGDIGDALYVLVAGEMDVKVRLPNGDVLRLATVQSSTVIGETGLLLDKPRSATATATGEAHLWKITPSHFAMALSQGDAWAVKLLLYTAQLLARRNTNLTEQLSNGAGGTPEALRNKDIDL